MKQSTRYLLSQLSLREVCDLAVEGSNSAFSYLAEVVRRRAFADALRLGRGLGLGVEDAEDAASEVALKFLMQGERVLGRFERKAAFLCKFARFGVIDHYRGVLGRFDSQKKLRDQGIAEIESSEEERVFARSLRRVMVRSAQDEKLADALGAGMTYRQIAAVFEVPTSQVFGSVRKMRARAHHHLEKERMAA